MCSYLPYTTSTAAASAGRTHTHRQTRKKNTEITQTRRPRGIDEKNITYFSHIVIFTERSKYNIKIN